MARALMQNLEMPPEGVLLSLLAKFVADFVPKVRLDVPRAAELGLVTIHGSKPHAEWVLPAGAPATRAAAARGRRARPAYGKHIPISRLFSANPTQMAWLKDVFGDVSSLFEFLLIEVKVKGTLPSSVPAHAVPKGKLINFCTLSHVHFDFENAVRSSLVVLGGRNPYEWVRVSAGARARGGRGPNARRRRAAARLRLRSTRHR